MRDARAAMHVGIANYRFPLKSAAGKTFPAFQVHAQRTIWEAYRSILTIFPRIASLAVRQTFDYLSRSDMKLAWKIWVDVQHETDKLPAIYMVRVVLQIISVLG